MPALLDPSVHRDADATVAHLVAAFVREIEEDMSILEEPDNTLPVNYGERNANGTNNPGKPRFVCASNLEAL